MTLTEILAIGGIDAAIVAIVLDALGHKPFEGLFPSSSVKGITSAVALVSIVISTWALADTADWSTAVLVFGIVAPLAVVLVPIGITVSNAARNRGQQGRSASAAHATCPTCACT